MISIVTALYKSDYYLPAYLKALRKFVAELQKRRVAFEVIFVPQKSNEKEKELLKTVSGQSWCRIIENPTPSLYMAWNTGASNARGDVIGFWNVDDIRFWPAVVEAEALVKAGADVVYFPFIIHRHLRMGPLDIVVAFKKIQGKAIEFEKRKFEISFPAGPHFMFSKKAYQAVGPFDEQFKIAGDFDWCARAAAKGLSFAQGREYSGNFRVDGRGLSTGGSPRHVVENNIVFIRQTAWDRMQLADETIIKEYRPKHIFFHGDYLPLSP